MRYFPIIASAAFLAADSFSVSATYHNSSVDFSQRTQQNWLPHLSPLIAQKYHNKNLLDQLDLDKEQTRQIKQIWQDYNLKIHQKRQQLQLAQQELVQMMTGTDTAEQIRAQHQEVLQLRRQLDELNFESLLATREVLALSQRQKLAQIMESRQKKSSQN